MTDAQLETILVIESTLDMIKNLPSFHALGPCVILALYGDAPVRVDGHSEGEWIWSTWSMLIDPVRFPSLWAPRSVDGWIDVPDMEDGASLDVLIKVVEVLYPGQIFEMQRRDQGWSVRVEDGIYQHQKLSLAICGALLQQRLKELRRGTPTPLPTIQGLPSKALIDHFYG